MKAPARDACQWGVFVIEALSSRECVPCRGGLPSLTQADAEALRAHVPDWSLQDGATRIERHFRFNTFAAAFVFVEKVATLAEAEDHHPDISFGWGYATVSFQTKIISGLHMNDFIMAAKVDALTERL